MSIVLPLPTMDLMRVTKRMKFSLSVKMRVVIVAVVPLILIAGVAVVPTVGLRTGLQCQRMLILRGCSALRR